MDMSGIEVDMEEGVTIIKIRFMTSSYINKII